MTDLITIDGSYGEGGGSIVRLSVALASLLNKKLTVSNIRANRKKPGLRLQHKTGIELIKQIKNGRVIGAEIGSQTIEYNPQKANNFEESSFFKIKVNTAASIGLIFQAVSLSLFKFKRKITIEISGGATYGQYAPAINYIQEITLNYFKKFGISSFSIQVNKHDFFPTGGSHVIIEYDPTKSGSPTTFNVNEKRENLQALNIFSVASKSLKKYNVADRQAKTLNQRLKVQFPEIDIISDVKYVISNSSGSGITLWGGDYPFGSSIVGKRGISSEKVGTTIFNQFYGDWKRGA